MVRALGSFRQREQLHFTSTASVIGLLMLLLQSAGLFANSSFDGGFRFEYPGLILPEPDTVPTATKNSDGMPVTVLLLNTPALEAKYGGACATAGTCYAIEFSLGTGPEASRSETINIDVGDGRTVGVYVDLPNDGSAGTLMMSSLISPIDGECVPAGCGNGAVGAGEECDDGNQVSGDGCSSTCQNEGSGPICGNGVLEAPEECDDGNTADGDWCSAFCIIESGCGNGVVEGAEECDDTNAVNTDACTNACRNAACGDGYIWAGNEDCDDGNTADGDGCSSTCTNEPVCGDGAVEGAEECDDGNTTNGDGCSSTCTNEVVCTPATIESSSGYSNVANAAGVVDASVAVATAAGATIDFDLNAVFPSGTSMNVYFGCSDTGGDCTFDLYYSLDGVSWNAIIPYSNTPTGTRARPITLAGDARYIRVTDGGFPPDTIQLVAGINNCGDPEPELCGDGTVNGSEVCDDGNHNPKDGCTADCTTEPVCAASTLESSTSVTDPANAAGAIDGDFAIMNGGTNMLAIDMGAQVASGTNVDIRVACDNPGGCDWHIWDSPDGSTIGPNSYHLATPIPAGFTWSIESFVLVAPTRYLIVSGGNAADMFYLDGFNYCGETVPDICGDGAVTGSEECDDGNITSGDGCAIDCTSEGSCSATNATPIAAHANVLNMSYATMDDPYRYAQIQSTGEDIVWDLGATWTAGESLSLIGLREGVTPDIRVSYSTDNVTFSNTHIASEPVSGTIDVVTWNTPVDARYVKVQSVLGGMHVFGLVGCGASTAACGDGTVDAGEECDDGNIISGDGCSNSCEIDGSCSASYGTVYASSSVANPLDSEGAPDGVTATISVGGYIDFMFGGPAPAGTTFYVTATSVTAGTVNPDLTLSYSTDGVTFGNTQTQTMPGGPYWEHVAFVSPVGATYVRVAFTNGGVRDIDALSLCSASFNACGDGTVVAPEQCDDGNLTNGDGCSSTCMNEGFCGDTICNGSETCATCPGDCGACCTANGGGCTVDGDCCGGYCDNGTCDTNLGCSGTYWKQLNGECCRSVAHRGCMTEQAPYNATGSPLTTCGYKVINTTLSDGNFVISHPQSSYCRVPVGQSPIPGSHNPNSHGFLVDHDIDASCDSWGAPQAAGWSDANPPWGPQPPGTWTSGHSYQKIPCNSCWKWTTGSGPGDGFNPPHYENSSAVLCEPHP